MNIIVTGGAGFIGSHVVERLVSKGHAVLVIDNFKTGREENLRNTDCTIVEADIRDRAKMEHIFDVFCPRAVIHLAAQPAITLSERNPTQDANINIGGTLSVLRAARRVDRFIFSSTSAVYAKSNEALREDSLVLPDSPYGISKLAAEHYVGLLSPWSVVLRFGNVFGPRQVPLGENQVIPRMIRHFLYGEEFSIHGDGDQVRDFVFVEDVATAIEKALTGGGGATYNISSGTSRSVNEVARQIESIFKVEGTYAWDYDDEIDGRGDVHMDVSAAKEHLEWTVKTDFKIALEKTIQWWREHGR